MIHSQNTSEGITAIIRFGATVAIVRDIDEAENEVEDVHLREIIAVGVGRMNVVAATTIDSENEN